MKFQYYIIWHKDTGYMYAMARKLDDIAIAFPNHNVYTEDDKAVCFIDQQDAIAMCALLNEAIAGGVML